MGHLYKDIDTRGALQASIMRIGEYDEYLPRETHDQNNAQKTRDRIEFAMETATRISARKLYHKDNIKIKVQLNT